MKFRFLLFLFIASCTSVCVSAKSWTQMNAAEYLFAHDDSVQLTAADIQGTWICFSSYFDGPSMDGREDVGPYHLETPETAIFSGDSLFEYNFPCELKRRHRYALQDKDTILIGETKYIIFLLHDTLSICLNRRTSGFMESDYEVRRYKRGSADSATVALLNKNGFNRDCLIGKWVLVTKFDTGYDGNGIVDIDFPFTLPYTLKITPQNVNAIMPGNGVMKISADGKLRPFYFDLREDNNAITCTTMEWFKSEWRFTFTYTRAE